MQSNGSVVLVHVGCACTFFNKDSPHIRVFTCETGASSPGAFGARLLAVLRQNHSSQLVHKRHAALASSQPKTAATEGGNSGAFENVNSNSKTNQDPDQADTTPDPALLSSMSTAVWSAVDVAKGVEESVEKSVSIGSTSVSYLASAARFVASAAGAIGDIYEEWKKMRIQRSTQMLRVRLWVWKLNNVRGGAVNGKTQLNEDQRMLVVSSSIHPCIRLYRKSLRVCAIHKMQLGLACWFNCSF